MKKYLITLFIWLFPAVCLAVPSITGVTTGEFDNNTNVTISGNNFGTKSPAAPVSFLNFENGTAGNTISESGWTSYSQGGLDANKPKYTTTHFGVGSNGMLCNPNQSGMVSGCSGTCYDMASNIYHSWSPAPSGQKFYLTYNIQRYGTAMSGSKFWRLRNGTTLPEFILSNLPGFYIADYNCVGTSMGGIKYLSSSSSTWYRQEFYGFIGDQNQSNGFLYMNQLRGAGYSPASVSSINFNSNTCGGQLYRLNLGTEFRAATSTSVANRPQAYYDNVYVDITPARIEIGDSPTFTSCQHREIQIPASWASGAVTFTVNTGTFNQSDSAYLFVIDSSNTPNTTGYPITIGEAGTSDTTAPVITNPLPTGVQTCTTDPRNITLQVTTNENATVKYGLSGENDLDTPANPVDANTSYDLLPHTMSTTGELAHSQVVSSACGASYTYYVRSMDSSLNKNTSSTAISYSVEAAAEVDIVPPTVTIASPADDPHEDVTQYVTVSGTSSAHGVKTISSITATGTTFQSIGSVTGTTNWSVPVVISQGTFSSDLLYGGGAFASIGSWSVGTNWVIADGTVSHTGVVANCWLGMTFASEIGKTYRVTYTVSGSPSGTLVFSQWGFGGVTQTLDSSAGTHTIDVVATRANSDLAFVANPWVGTLDNVTVKRVQYDTLTITATDNLGYANTDTIQMGYTAPETVTPHKVVGLSATRKIDLGGGKQLEF